MADVIDIKTGQPADGTPLMLRDPSQVNPLGALTYIRDTEVPRWKITGSPVVTNLAARLFSGSISKKADTVSFPAVQSSFEDLVMLLHRYPLLIHCRPEWDQFHNALREAHRWATTADDMVATPSLFKGSLLPFQQAGLRFMLGSRRSLLADDMGLGKTPQGLAFLAHVATWPAAIVCQPHMMRHWEDKACEFLHITKAGLALMDQAGGGLRYARLDGARDRPLPGADVYIVHYLTLYAWSEKLIQAGVKAVLFDECQELRHPGTRKHEAAKNLSYAAQSVVGLSGTPVYNRGGEMFDVMNTLNRGCLGTQTDFKRSWCIADDVVEHPEVLGRYLTDRRLMLRRRKDEVLGELPAKRRAVEHIDGDNKVFAELVKSAIEKAKQAELIANPFDRARMEAEALAQTRMATGVAKAPAVVAFLTGLLEAGETVICFAHHHAVHDAISEGLAHFKPARITGRESMSQKEEAKKAFVNGNTNLIQIALRSATGIDGLQARARCVVFAELDWSPAIHRQGEDRAHRMGQKDSVLAYYLVTDLGTDPGMILTIGMKEWQFAGVMQDKPESEEDRKKSEAAVKQHMDAILRKLRKS